MSDQAKQPKQTVIIQRVEIAHAEGLIWNFCKGSALTRVDKDPKCWSCGRIIPDNHYLHLALCATGNKTLCSECAQPVRSSLPCVS